MSDKVFIYDGTDEALRQVYELKDSDVRIVCSVCQDDLLVALDPETAGRLRVHPGIYCTKHPEHLTQRIIFRPKKKIV